MFKAVIFDLDNTLYDTRYQVANARKNAVKAMVDAGLPASYEKAYQKLTKVVKNKGSNYPRHYDELLSSYGLEPDPKIIAAGVIAYHNTKRAYLVPYSDTVQTLLVLRDMGLKLAVVTDGVAVKQWEKIISLGLKDFFHTVIVNEDEKEQKPNPKSLLIAAKKMGVQACDTLVVGDTADSDIKGAKNAGMCAVQIVKGENQENSDYANHRIERISELVDIIR